MDVGSRARSAVRWTAGAKLAGQVLTWAITLVVIRLLAPADYGLMAMTAVFVIVVDYVADLGLGFSVVQARKLERAQLQLIYGALIVTNLAAAVLIFASAPLIAAFFGEPQLIPLVRAMSLQFVLAAASRLPSSLLQRDLRFRALSLIDLSGAVTGSLIALALALHGYGVWALIAATLGKAALRALALNMIAPPRITPRFGVAGMSDLFTLGGLATLNRILWVCSAQVDALIVGRLLGKEALGFYSVAIHLAMLPLTKLLGVVQPVAMPAFARIQDDLPRGAEALKRAVRVLVVAAFPVFWGISAVAPEIVGVILGAKWAPALLPLQLVPLVMPLRLVWSFTNTAVDGVGRVKVSLGNTVTILVAMAAGLVVASRWGILGISVAWVTLYPLVIAFSLRRSLEVFSLRLGEVSRLLARPFAATVLMYAAVAVTREALLGATSQAVQLVVLVAAGALTYTAATLAFNRPALWELVRVARR
jgi:O-antigen/teichoic acid export membrane protein